MEGQSVKKTLRFQKYPDTCGCGLSHSGQVSISAGRVHMNSVDKIYILRPNYKTQNPSQPEGLGVAFFATGPGLGLIMYILSTLEFPTYKFNFQLLTTSVNAKYYYNIPLYFTGITISLIYIYWTRAQVVSNGFCSSVVEHWSCNPEDAGSIPSRKALELHFSQLVPVWVL